VHISRLVLVWKQRPGAWYVEPPVWARGPWSTTTTAGVGQGALVDDDDVRHAGLGELPGG